MGNVNREAGERRRDVRALQKGAVWSRSRGTDWNGVTRFWRRAVARERDPPQDPGGS